MQQIIRVRRISNPRTRRKSTKVSARRGRRKASSSRSRNPLRVLTLGASNPRSAKKVTRKRRKRTTASRPRRRRTALSAAPRRRRRNSRHVHRASNPRRRRRRNQTRIVIRRNARRRRNQGPTTAIKSVFGGLLGVTGTKMIPGVLPGQLTATPIMASLTSVGVAWGLGELIKRFDRSLGEAVQFGGYMQAGSVVLNAFIPSIGGQIALRGMRGLGELVQGAFSVPQNPLNPMQANYPVYGQGAAVGNGVTPSMNGLARAFPSSF